MNQTQTKKSALDTSLEALGLTRDDAHTQSFDIQAHLQTQADIDGYVEAALTDYGDDKQFIARVLTEAAIAQKRLNGQDKQRLKAITPKNLATQIGQVLPDLVRSGLQITSFPANA